MRVRLQLSSLRETKPMEWVSRFVWGGVVTVLAGLVAKHWGPVIGGLFLAFPGIFPPSSSLVEKHKVEREAREGKQGVRSARAEASVEAAGASAGALGLAAFAAVLWRRLPQHGAAGSLLVAFAAWAMVSWAVWMMRDRL